MHKKKGIHTSFPFLPWTYMRMKNGSNIFFCASSFNRNFIIIIIQKYFIFDSDSIVSTLSIDEVEIVLETIECTKYHKQKVKSL